MVDTVDIDMTKFSAAMDGLRAAFLDGGMDSDAAQIVQSETKLLSMEIAGQMPPKRKSKLESAIARDIRMTFYAMPREPLKGDQRHGEDMEWILPGPQFLYGVKKENLRLRMSEQGMREAHYKGEFPRERTKVLGSRGKQKVYEIQRIVTTRARIKKLNRKISSSYGRLKASFAQAAQQLGHMRIPKWMSKHFPSPKAIVDVSGLTDGSTPVVTFGSRAPGVTAFGDIVRTAIAVRVKKMLTRTKLVLSGYNKDIAAGMRPRKRAKEADASS